MISSVPSTTPSAHVARLVGDIQRSRRCRRAFAPYTPSAACACRSRSRISPARRRPPRDIDAHHAVAFAQVPPLSRPSRCAPMSHVLLGEHDGHALRGASIRVVMPGSPAHPPARPLHGGYGNQAVLAYVGEFGHRVFLMWPSRVTNHQLFSIQSRRREYRGYLRRHPDSAG